MGYFYPDKTWQGIKQDWPRIRLQVWFSRWGENLGDVYDRYVDIDPESWAEIWDYADRVLVVV